MRTVPADSCNNFAERLDVRQGILYYDGHKKKWPTTTEGKYVYACRDEPHDRLRPVVPWTVPRLTHGEKSELSVPNSTIKLAKWSLPAEPHRPNSTGPEVNNWRMMENTLWVNYSYPTVNNTDGPFGDNAAVYPVEKTPLSRDRDGNWTYMVIIGNQTNLGPPKGGKLVPAAHPVSIYSNYLERWSNLTHVEYKDTLPRPRFRAPETVRASLQWDILTRKFDIRQSPSP